MAMDFDERLDKAIQRGKRSQAARERAAAEQALSEEELKRLHTNYRLQVSEHIEQCMRRLVDHFPGFRYEGVVGERGWGSAASRDDLVPGANRQNVFSRVEITVRPYGHYPVLELAARGTVRNKEVYNRTHYQRLEEVDVQDFLNMVDLWILQYAELFAAAS